MKIKALFPTRTAVAVAAALFSTQAISAGFALNDHSATASGNALAGAAASRSDISFGFWNPALFANAKGKELYVSGALVMPEMDVTVNEAKSPFQQSITNDGAPDNIVDNNFVPSAYFAFPLSDATVVGASLNVPFGLSGEYGDEWAGRYHSAKTSVRDMSLAVSLAHRLNKKLTFGGSLQLHRGEVTLEAAVPNATLDGGGNVTAIGADGYGSLEADDIALGFSLGMLFEPMEGTRLGLGYRSEIDFEFEGDAKYTNVGGSQGNLGNVKGIDNAAISDNLTFPSVLTLSAEHDFNDKLTLGATAMRTGWSSLEEMRIKFEKGADGKAQDDSVLTFGFEDQWFYSIGATYAMSEKLTLRSGVAVDNSPATDKYRSARTPDGDRKWLSFGASYNLGKAGEVTAAFTHVAIEDVSVVRDGSLTEDSGRGKLDADYELSANVFSFAYNVTF